MTTHTGTLYATQTPFGCTQHRIIRGYYSPLFQVVWAQINLNSLDQIFGIIQTHEKAKRKGNGTYSLFAASSATRLRRVCWRAYPASLFFAMHTKRTVRPYPVQGGGVVITQSVGQIWPTNG